MNPGVLIGEQGQYSKCFFDRKAATAVLSTSHCVVADQIVLKGYRIEHENCQHDKLLSKFSLTSMDGI